MDMIYFNILFDGCENDVDIICVPYSIASEMNVLAQKFLDWLPNADDKIYWTIINNRKVSVCETDGFIKWINENYCKTIPKSYVVIRHSKICNEHNQHNQGTVL